MSPLLLILAVLSTAPAASTPLAIFNGQPVAEIKLNLPPDEIPIEINRLIGIDPGEPFNRQQLRQATTRLYKTGRFQYIDVNAGRTRGGVALHFTLKAKRYIHNITSINLEDLDQDKFMAAIGYRTGDEFEPDTIKKIGENAIKYLHDNGYYEGQAEVTIFESPQESEDHYKQVDLGIIVHLGAPTIIKEVVISGQPALDKEVLRRQLKTQAGQIYSGDRLHRDHEDLLKKYRSRGFLEATIDEPQVTIEDNRASINFHINAGKRIRLDFDGNQVLSDNFLAGLLKLRNGEALNRSQLTGLREEIRKNYIELGYYQVQVTMTTDDPPDQPDKIYHYTIKEGPYLPVSKVEFIGIGKFYKTSKAARDEFFAYMRSGYDASLFGQLLDNDDLQKELGPAVGRTDSLALSDGKVQLSKPSISARNPTHVYIDWLYKKALEHLRGTYRSNGYLKMRFTQPQIAFEADPHGSGSQKLAITIGINEGPQTLVEKRLFTGLDPADQAYLEKNIALQVEQPLSETAIDKSRQVIRNYFNSRGYIYTTIDIDYQLSPDSTRATVRLNINPGPQVRINTIIIQGREHVRQDVIMAQLTLKSGDIYIPAEASRSRQFLMSLGVFSMAAVELVEAQTPAMQKDLLVRVTERNRQSLGAGIGLSTEDGIRGSIQYNHLNLFGVALGLNTSLKLNRQFFFSLYGSDGEQMSRRYQQYKPFTEALERELRLTLTAPYLGFLPREISLSLSLVNERDNTLSYSLDSSSAALAINYKPRRELAVQLEQSVTYNSLQCVSGDDCSNPVDDRGNIKRIDAGTYTLYKVIPSIKLDFRDNSFNPHKGFWSNISLEYSAGIGKPISFFKLEGQFSFYIPAGDRLTIAMAASMGQIFNLGNSFPISDSFYFGGRSSVRGYYERSIIPSDVCVVTPDGQTIYGDASCSDTLNATNQSDGSYYVQTKGGRSYGLFRIEGRVKLYGQLSLGLFADVGNLVMDFSHLFTTAPRFGVGFGVRYETPLGPLALDFGFDPIPRKNLGESIFQLHFSVGLF